MLLSKIFSSRAAWMRLSAFLVIVFFVAFKLTTLVHEPARIAEAVTCTSGKCEAAGHCWDVGSKANGPDGCEYTCSGGSWGGRTNCSAERQAQHDADYNRYQQQQSGQSTGSQTSTGTTTTTSNVATTCASGSASGCTGQPFYSRSTTNSSMVCFPNGVTTTGLPVCGRDTTTQVKVNTDPTTGQPVGGYLLTAEGTGAVTGPNNTPRTTNPAAGGCPVVAICGCPSGQVSLCMSSTASLGGNTVADYCAKSVCTPIGVDGKICTPGQVSECQGQSGKICNPDGKTYRWVAAHACGATHTIAYCSSPTGGGTNTGAVCASGARTYDTLLECQQAGGTNCSQGRAQIVQPASTTVADYCKTLGPVSSLAYKDCMATYQYDATARARDAAKFQAAGACVPGVSFSVFAGCGTGSQARYNCYSVCSNGTTSRTCRNEPGLSCGAHEGNVIAVAAAQAETRFTQSTPTTPSTPQPSNRPSPQPTPTPTATCGQPCGASAGGAYCTGSNMACVSGTCRSTLCSVNEQNAQCICTQPSPPPMACIDIFASKTDIKLGDQVTFTCAEVPNAVRYEFRYAYVTSKTSITGAVLNALNPATATSRTSVPITVDKIGRYIAQCRPCAANNLCTEWEPLDGQIGGPKLETSTTTTTASPSPTPTTSTATNSATQNATTSGQM